MENQQTVGTQFRILSILHAALCGGVIIVLFLFRYLVKHDANAQPDNNPLMEIIGIAVGFISVLLSRFLFFMRTRQAMTTPIPFRKNRNFQKRFHCTDGLAGGSRADQCCILLHHQKRSSFLHRPGYSFADVVLDGLPEP
jgi:hypothetical protein